MFSKMQVTQRCQTAKAWRQRYTKSREKMLTTALVNYQVVWALTGNLYKAVPRFGEFCACCCLLLLSQLVCSILATWERPYRDSLYTSDFGVNRALWYYLLSRNRAGSSLTIWWKSGCAMSMESCTSTKILSGVTLMFWEPNSIKN